MKMNLSVELSAHTYGNSADELRRALGSVPDGATYNIMHHSGDRPWESDSFTIEFEWTEKR
jgi:hypothetical protein